MQMSFPDRRVPRVGNTFIDVGSEESYVKAKPVSGILQLKRSRSYAGYVPHDLVPLHAAAERFSLPKSKGNATQKSFDEACSGSFGKPATYATMYRARTPMSVEQTSMERESPIHEQAPVNEQVPTFEQAPAKEDITTLMLRNLPKTLTQRELMEEIDKSGFGGLYDFCYLPHSFANVEGRGFAFVNFTSAGAAGMFVGSWHRQRRCGLRAHEPAINISPAALQGLERNAAKWDTPRLRRIRNPNNVPFMRAAPAASFQEHSPPLASRRTCPAGEALGREVMFPRGYRSM